MKPWIVITGADGTGKTSSIAKLESFLEAKKVSTDRATIWDAIASHFPNLAQDQIQKYLTDIDATSRTLFLLQAMLSSVRNKLDTTEADLVIVDSYIYKYLATEKLLGTNLQPFEKLLDEFPKPDLVVELKAPLSVILRRKSSLSLYERMTAQGLTSPELERKIEECWIEVREMFGPFVAVENQSDYESLMRELSPLVEERLWAQSL
ncbi:MAG: hypothetical protein AAF202_03355 [Pseudomonadota bacterium]